MASFSEEILKTLEDIKKKSQNNGQLSERDLEVLLLAALLEEENE